MKNVYLTYHHFPNCQTSASTWGAKLLGKYRQHLGMSISKTLAFAVIALLVSGISSNAEALVPAQEVKLPSVDGFQIEATRRSSSVTCSARPKEESSQGITLLANTGKYRGGVWFLSVTSLNHHLKPGVQKTAAYLFLNGHQVIKGMALTTIGGFVRFDFTAIDAYIKDIKASDIVEIQTKGINPLKLQSLSPPITAIEKCLQESSNPDFWKDAEYVCN